MDKHGLYLAALCLGFACTSAALAYDTPEELIDAVYAPYLAGEVPAEDVQVMQRSSELNALFDAAYAATPDGEMGPLDFDPLVDGQDFDLDDLVIGEPEIDTGVDVGTIAVSFSNFGEPRELTFTVVKEADGWHYLDVSRETSDYSYSLLDILQNYEP
ncbi:MAG: hypothetical protein JWR75_151 [Devosia sp.]|nr:hypothetical protein [Devosia sp.]